MTAAWKWGLGAFAGLRLLATSAALFANARLEIGEVIDVGHYIPPSGGVLYEALVGTWVRADALWYLSIAEGGYTSTSQLAFFPVFPLLIRVVNLVIPDEVIAAIVVSNVACALGLVLLYRLAEDLGGKQMARSAVVGLAAFPTAFFLVAPYAESVLLATGAGALLAARRQSPALAGLLGGLAVLSRPFGVLVVIPLFFMLRRSDRWALFGPASAVAVWAVWGWFLTGRLTGIVEVQSIWQRELAFPLSTLWSGFIETLNYRLTDLFGYFAFDLLAWLVGAGLVVATAIYLRERVDSGANLSLLAYGAAVLLLPAAYPFPPRPLLSFPRFVLALFPAFGGYAVIPRGLRYGIWMISAAGGFWATSVYVAARPLF